MSKKQLAIDAARAAMPESLHLPETATALDWLMAIAADHKSLRMAMDRRDKQLAHARRAYDHLIQVFGE